MSEGVAGAITPASEESPFTRTSLVDLLLSLERYKPSRRLVLIIFDALVGGPFDLASVQFIKQPEALNVLLDLLPHAAPTLQIEIITNLITLCDNSIRNCIVCHKYGLLAKLLELCKTRFLDKILFEKIIQLITVLARFHISVYDLSLYLSIIRSLIETHMPLQVVRMVKALQHMTQNAYPVGLFDFDGSKDCAIILPPFQLTGDGYTVAFWLRIEAFPSSTNHFRLFNLLNEEGDGVILYLSQRHGHPIMNVNHLSNGNVTSQMFDGAALPQNEWCHIALVHVPRLFGRSEIKLYINGQLRQSKNVSYISTSKPFSRSSIGSDASLTFSFIPSTPSFCGQIAWAALLGEAATDDKVQSLYMIDPDSPQKISASQAFSNVLVFALSASAHEEDIIYDIGPTAMHAARVGELLCWVRNRLADTIFCAGGLSDLLHGIPSCSDEAPTIDSKQSTTSRTWTKDEIQEANDLTSHLLTLVNYVLEASESNRQDVLQSEFFDILAFVFEEVSSNRLDSNFLLSIDKMISTLSSLDQNLAKELYLKVLLNFRLWSHCSFALQKQVVLMIVKHATNKPKFFRENFGVQELLDVMCQYYPYSAEQGSSDVVPANDSQKQGKSKAKTNMNNNEICEIRSVLFYVMRVIMSGITETDMRALVSFVLDNGNALEILDALHFMLWVFKKFDKRAYTALKSLGDVQLFVGLLQHPNERVRIYTIRLISLIAVIGYSDSKRSTMLMENVTPWLYNAITDFTFTDETYKAVMELMLGIPQQPHSRDSSLDMPQTSSFLSLDLDGTQFIEIPEIIPVIFQLVQRAPLELKTKALQDFLMLLSHGKLNSVTLHNANAIMSDEMWPDWLLTALVEAEAELRASKDAKGKDKDNDNAVIAKEMAIRIFNTLLFFAISTKRDGWRLVMFVSAAMELFKGRINSISLQRELFTTLFTSITTELTRLESQSHSQNRQILLENIVMLMLLMEEFVFCCPSNINLGALDKKSLEQLTEQHLRAFMHRDSSNEDIQQFPLPKPVILTHWLDFNMVKVLLDLFFVAFQLDADFIAKVDTTTHFGKDRHNIFYCVIRLLLTTLAEALPVLQPKAFRDKRNYINDLEAKILQSTSPLLSSEFTRRQLTSYILEVCSEIDKEEQSIETFFVKQIERLKILIQHCRKLSDANNPITTKQMNIEIILHAIQQILKLLKRLAADKDPLHILLVPHVKSLFHDNVEGILDEAIPVLPDLETNPFVDNRFCFESSSPINDFLLFYQEILESKPVAKQRLAKATQIVEHEQLKSLKAMIQRREDYIIETKRMKDKKRENHLDFIQRALHTKNTVAQQIAYKETIRRVSCAQAERKARAKVSKTFNYVWKKLNDASVIWKSFLLEPRLNNSSKMFTKIDKSEQDHRIRKKIKKNYEGKQHTEASFTYLRQLWRRDADALRQRQSATSPSNSPPISPPISRPSSPSNAESLTITEENNQTQSAEPIKNESTPQQNKITDIPPSQPTDSPSAEEIVEHSETMSLKDESTSPENRTESQPQETVPSTPAISTTSTSCPRLPFKERKSAVISIEQEVDELLTNIDEGDFELLADSTTSDDTSSLGTGILFSCKCDLVLSEVSIPGRLDVTRTTLNFYYDRESAKVDTDAEQREGGKSGMDYRMWTRRMFQSKFRDREWSIERIVAMHSRRYMLSWTAIEIFFENHRNYFFNFPKDKAKDLYKTILQLKPPKLRDHYFATGAQVFKKKYSEMTERWKRREISNFDYLMYLNQTASRTYNDLTQYPVFPWILSNYTSKRIDLSDPSNYRDLKLPVGALNPERFAKFQDRYDSWMDDTVPPFHYGSHYSTAGTTLFYLIRVEPFTSGFLCLQGGKFDYPDRLFSSLAETWENCLKSTTDVKELIPEFFCCPEFLINRNRFDLGVKSNGVQIDDVELPPWASSPEEFIRIHREALESEYVSANLHHWIDLIFGYKQRGPEAIAAKNTFYYVTYEGAVDIDSLTNPVMRKAILTQVESFGQTPAQLLTTPHPPRDPPKGNLQLWFPLDSDIPADLFEHTTLSVIQLPFNTPYFLFVFKEQIITFNLAAEYLIHQWTLKPSSSSDSEPLKLKIDGIFSAVSSITTLPTAPKTYSRKLRVIEALARRSFAGNRRLDFVNPLQYTSKMRPRCVSITSDLVVSWGHPNAEIKFSALASALSYAGQPVPPTPSLLVVKAHHALVTCAAYDDGYLVTGSQDTTARLWQVDINQWGKQKVEVKMLYTLAAHVKPITCVAISRAWDLIVTGSEDGMLCIFSLNLRHCDPRFVLEHSSRILSICIVPFDGSIIVQTAERIVRYNINGDIIATIDHPRTNPVVLPSRSGRFIVTVEGNRVAVRRINDLEIVYMYNSFSNQIVDMAWSPDEKVLFVALADGKLCCLYKRDARSALLP